MGEEAGPDALGKVGAGVRRVTAWAVVAGAAVGVVGSLAGCMEVGPAVAPTGAGVPTAGVGDEGSSQDGVHAKREGKHHPGESPGAEAAASASASASPGGRPSAAQSAAAGGGVGLPVAVSPAPSATGVPVTPAPPASSGPSPAAPSSAGPVPSTSPTSSPTLSPTPSTSASPG